MDLSEVKTIISSLLISNPNKSTVRSLNNDFRNDIGCSIPFESLGYDTLEAFLRSMPDKLAVLGSGPNAELHVFVSDKVAHIDSMMSKQKKTNKKKQNSRFINNGTVKPLPGKISSSSPSPLEETNFPSSYPNLDNNISDKSKCLPTNVESEKILEKRPRRKPNCGFSPDIVKLDESIPRVSLSEEVVELSEVELQVSEVCNPSSFWVILDKNYPNLEKLMVELQFYYSAKGHELRIKEDQVAMGMYCVALYENEFHRVLVNEVNKNCHQASAFYIDYGTIATVDSRDLYSLDKIFSYLPQQAIHARLAGVYPKIEQSGWTIEAILQFKKLVQCRSLIAKIVRIDREEQVVDVVLRGTDKLQHNINDILIRENLGCTKYNSGENNRPKRRGNYYPGMGGIF